MATTWQVEVLVPGDGNADPFRYGWRYVKRIDERGAETWEQEPLTLLDVLHPQEGDFIVQSDPHTRRCVYLYDVLRVRLASDPTAVVLHDVGVDWGVAGIRPHSPDISVFLGVRERKRWSSFSVIREGAQPAFVIEVTSPTTAVLDRSTKVEQYERVGLPIYILVDTIADGQEAAPRLIGYQLADGRYQTLAPDERGRLWLEAARTWLGVEAGEVVCYDEAGQPLGDYQALTTALAAAEQQAAAERQAREEAEHRAAAEREAREVTEARLRTLEQELRRLRGDRA
jgi:Uma2 family endonuclease